MWNRALSPDDIAALFAERADFTSALVPGSVDKLLGRVGYWDFENCDGKTVGGIIPDVSGNGNDLTIGAGSCSPTGGRVGAAWSLAGGTAASNKLYREAIRLYDGGNAPLTVTGWFKFSSLSNYMGTLSVGATGGRQHFYIRAKVCSRRMFCSLVLVLTDPNSGVVAVMGSYCWLPERRFRKIHPRSAFDCARAAPIVISSAYRFVWSCSWIVEAQTIGSVRPVMASPLLLMCGITSWARTTAALARCL